MRFIITAHPGADTAPADPSAPFDEQLFTAYMRLKRCVACRAPASNASIAWSKSAAE